MFYMKFILISLLCISSYATKPQYGGTLVFGRSGDSISLDPSLTSEGESSNVTASVYDNLVQFEYGTTKIIPGLAKSWDISKDGLTYTFHLRKNVYFSKTKFFNKKVKFTSKDVLFTFKRQYDKNNPYHELGGKHKLWQAMDMSNIVKDIIAVDKYTVKFILNKKESPFIANLAMNFAMILSSDYANYLLKNNKQYLFEKEPVGTGPFVFEKWIKNDKIILNANLDYWDNRPYLDKLIVKVMKKNSARTEALKSEKIHIMDYPNPYEIKSLKRYKNIKFAEQEGLNVAYLAFNQNKKPFDNKLVRQAISHAINLKVIMKSVYKGMARIATNPIPPTLWSYKKDLKHYEFDLEKAKKLLKQAGYENGFETNIYPMPIARPYNPNAKKVAQIIKSNLAKIGIKVKIILKKDWKTYLKETSTGMHDMVLYGWTGDNADPDNFFNVLLSKKSAMKIPSQNRAFWKNDKFSNLINKAKETSDVTERTKLYEEAQDIFYEEAVWKPIAHSIIVEPMITKVHGFKLEPIGKKRFNKVWLSK